MSWISAETCIKATTAENGEVWVLAGDGRAENTRKGLPDFIDSLPAYGLHLRFRVPMLPRNAELALQLHGLAMDGRLSSVAIGSPRCCGCKADLADPSVLLYAARNFEHPASVGGWRKIADADEAALQFVAARHCAATPPPLSRHPIGELLTFVDGLNAESCASLLGLIGDPRWFIDPANPDRLNKLPQFLGLDPRTQRNAALEREKLSRNRLVKSCWRGERSASPRSATLRPGQFLWGAWHRKGGGWAGDLAASKKFVSFVQRLWLAAACGPARAGEMFAASLFFSEPAVSEAFEFFAQEKFGWSCRA